MVLKGLAGKTEAKPFTLLLVDRERNEVVICTRTSHRWKSSVVREAQFPRLRTGWKSSEKMAHLSREGGTFRE